MSNEGDSVNDWVQAEQDIQHEIRDMDGAYERIWGQSRPTGR